MRAAKTFAYVSLGILAVVVTSLSIHRTATGQPLRTLTVGGISFINGIDYVGLDQEGMLWATGANGTVFLGPIALPETGRVVAVSGVTTPALPQLFVLYEDGNSYQWKPSTGWTLGGNVFSGAPVQATETTWGRIKAERR
jgi:hypothetical protein